MELTAALSASLRIYRDVVFDLCDSGCRPSSPLGLLPLGPGAHAAIESYRAAINLHVDTASINLCASFQRFLDLSLYVGRRNLWLYLYVVGNAEHSPQLLNC